MIFLIDYAFTLLLHLFNFASQSWLTSFGIVISIISATFMLYNRINDR